MASSSDQASDHPRFLSFRSPPPTASNRLPVPQPLLPVQATPPSSALSTSPEVTKHAPLAARASGVPSAKKKSSKKRRKPRTSKRSQTTFIAADASNFRQMVQQVTGVRFDNTSVMRPSLSRRPEALRAGGSGRSLDIPGMSFGNDLLDSMAGLSPATRMFDMPMVLEQRAVGLYGELLGLGAGDNNEVGVGVGEVGSGLEWAAATSFHT